LQNSFPRFKLISCKGKLTWIALKVEVQLPLQGFSTDYFMVKIEEFRVSSVEKQADSGISTKAL
jgi:hypothetical protein